MTAGTPGRDAAVRPLVLCVDDQPLILKLLRHHLEAMGCRAEGVTSADAALEALAKERPALVLLDARMPGMSGYELCASMQQTGLNVPVVFVTSLGSEENRTRAFAAGAVDHIVKPILAKSLIPTVEKHLRRSDPWTVFARSTRAPTPESQSALLALALSLGLDTNDVRVALLSLTDLYSACALVGVRPREMAQHVAEVAKLPFISEVNADDLALGVLPAQFCRAKLVLPLRDALGETVFVVANPFDLELRDALGKSSGVGRPARFLVTYPEAITRVFDSTNEASQASCRPCAHCGTPSTSATRGISWRKRSRAALTAEEPPSSSP